MANLQRDDYAIVVGIDHYPQYGKSGRNLNGAVRDAKLFHEWLLNKDTGGGLSRDRCLLIPSTKNPRSVTLDRIDWTLRKLWDKACDAGGGRRFYFYFAGHGQSITAADTNAFEQAFCLPLWSHKMPNAALNVDSYSNVVQQCMPFTEIVLFLDCCRVPAVKVRANYTQLGCPTPLDNHDRIERMVYFAAEPMRRAFEGDLGAEDDQPEVHGFFTAALLEALRKGSDRPGGGIGAESLWTYLDYRVPQIADVSGRRQLPRRQPLRFSDDVVFGAARPSSASPPGQAVADSNYEIRFSPVRRGPIRLVDGAGKELRVGDPLSGPWHVRLKPGQTYILIDEGDGQHRGFIFLAANEGRHDIF